MVGVERVTGERREPSWKKKERGKGREGEVFKGKHFFFLCLFFHYYLTPLYMASYRNLLTSVI